MKEAHQRIIFPLDVSTEAEAWQWCFALRSSVGVMKVGLELFTRLGPQALEAPKGTEFQVFLDLKLHDIPNTVGKAAANARTLGADFLSVHAAGGSDMMKAAVDAAGPDTTVLAITVLTSLAGPDFSTIFNQTENSVEYVVKKLADIAFEAGARGFVCSPLEVKMLREHLGPDVSLVVPGVRPKGSAVNDQKRVATPFEAIQNGAGFLVIGRPIRNADDPRTAAGQIAQEIASAL